MLEHILYGYKAILPFGIFGIIVRACFVMLRDDNRKKNIRCLIRESAILLVGAFLFEGLIALVKFTAW